VCIHDLYVRSGGHQCFVRRFAGRARELDAKHSDVVALSERLRLLDDVGSRRIADGAGAIEAEE
jgi:hypothetical protein